MPEIDDHTREIARHILQAQRAATSAPKIRYALVNVQNTADFTVDVVSVVDDGAGGSTPVVVPAVPCLAETLPDVGDTVGVIEVGGGWVCVGTRGAGNWTAFVPTLGGVTAIGTGGTKYGYYRMLGKELRWKAGFTLGTAPTLAGAITIDGPFTASNQQQHSGSAVAIDVSAQLRYSADCYINGNDTTWALRFCAANAGWNNTSPFTWAATDFLHASGTIILA